MPSKETLAAPVLICGGGPVGLSLALGLARCGIRSIVIEKKAALDPHSRALGVLPRTLEIFRAWGVLDSFLDAGIFRSQIQVAVPGRSTPVTTIDLALMRKYTPAAGLLVLPQDETERLLLDEVLRCSFCEVRFNQTLLDFSQDESGVEARIKSEGGEYSVRVPFLIGCDGARSRVREVLGWELVGKTYPTQMLIADVELRDARDALPWPRVAPLPRGVLAALRFSPHHWRIIHSLPKEQSDASALSEEYIASLVEKLWGAGEFGTIWKSVFRIHRRRSKRWFQGRVALAGDACHLNSPAGGQGMNSGIQDAHNLAWKLAAILQSDSQSSTRADAGVLLASYESERGYAIKYGVERFTDLLTQRLLLAPPALQRTFLIAVAIAARFTFIRERIMLRMTMLDVSYPRSAILQSGGFPPLTGHRAPDGDLSKDGETRRLLDFVFPNAVLILFDDARLPRWDESAIRQSVENIAPTKIRVLRVLKNDVATEADAWRDASGKLWSAWQLDDETGGATAALIRPDGHVGWIAIRPSIAQLQSGIKSALGVIP